MKKNNYSIYGANKKYLKWLRLSDTEVRKLRKRFPKSTFKKL
jgi:hypothetical protein